MKKYNLEEKMQKLNIAWNSIRNGIKIIRKTFENDSGIELWTLRLEAVNSNLHKEILRKIKPRIFEEEK